MTGRGRWAPGQALPGATPTHRKRRNIVLDPASQNFLSPRESPDQSAHVILRPFGCASSAFDPLLTLGVKVGHWL
jgi:hypothetical protein